MFRWWCLISLAVVLSGCDSGGQTRLQEYIKTVKARPPRAIEPIPVFTKPDVFSYTAEKERNPFAPYVDMRSDHLSLGPDRNRAKEPLEAFPLDALKIVGTMNVKDHLWALITAPDGKIYKARTGNYLGQNYGKIESIASDGIHLTEMVNISGDWEKKPAKLLIGTEE
jgi:type IV pilus assembly protein PilP